MVCRRWLSSCGRVRAGDRTHLPEPKDRSRRRPVRLSPSGRLGVPYGCAAHRHIGRCRDRRRVMRQLHRDDGRRGGGRRRGRFDATSCPRRCGCLADGRRPHPGRGGNRRARMSVPRGTDRRRGRIPLRQSQRTCHGIRRPRDARHRAVRRRGLASRHRQLRRSTGIALCHGLTGKHHREIRQSRGGLRRRRGRHRARRTHRGRRGCRGGRDRRGCGRRSGRRGIARRRRRRLDLAAGSHTFRRGVGNGLEDDRRGSGRLLRQQAFRIDVPLRVGLSPHAKMDVGTAHFRISARPDRPDAVAFGDSRVLLDRDGAQMSERHRPAVGSLNRQRPPATRDHSRERDDPARWSSQRLPHVARDVDPAVLPGRVWLRRVE